MSGYFQRLAQSVTQPTQRVHPMVGSFFAPVSQETDSEPSLEFTQTSARAHTAEIERNTAEPIEERKEEHQQATVPLNRPLMVPERVESRVHEQRPSETQMESPVKVVREERTVTTHADTHGTAAQKAFTPLMPVVAKAVPAAAPLTTQPLPKAARKADKPASAAAQRDADDIQIHIGRVEVIAVPPTPAPVAAKAPRKSASSLDEYLRRRDRRPL